MSPGDEMTVHHNPRAMRKAVTAARINWLSFDVSEVVSGSKRARPMTPRNSKSAATKNLLQLIDANDNDDVEDDEADNYELSGVSSEETGDEDALHGGDGVHQSESRNATCSVQVTKKPVFVPPPQAVHGSWGAWKAHLDTYQKDTHQVI